eukprot:TRINITY_DN24045_c0_g1_i1.p1 TRINITY_DN24045_c0_g1~~TRINITY_DN24045_c0_g1_i1.p1  ORF type:complete len:955 (-),score=107.89 TRINITY_DN24045_c0_g1_i1:102-2966(-)
MSMTRQLREPLIRDQSSQPSLPPGVPRGRSPRDRSGHFAAPCSRISGGSSASSPLTGPRHQSSPGLHPEQAPVANKGRLHANTEDIPDLLLPASPILGIPRTKSEPGKLLDHLGRRTEEWRDATPLERRKSSRRQLNRALYAPPGIGAMASLSFPHFAYCLHCNEILRASEAISGTGLCGDCYDESVKECSICRRTLPLKQLQFGSGLCKPCYNACEKQCRVCNSNLALGQLWGTGLCDRCYGRVVTECRMCGTGLQSHQLHWGTGLCDWCYDTAEKDCVICGNRLGCVSLKWGSGLCDTCYDDSQKTCRACRHAIPLGSLRWRTGLCDACFDLGHNKCNTCQAPLQAEDVQGTTCLCKTCRDKETSTATCKRCRDQIPAEARRWNSGLCDVCYDACEKTCKTCKEGIPLGQIHWGSGLCDRCYGGCQRECRMCKKEIDLGQLHWGTRLCDPCFDSCEKQCRMCKQRMNIGDLRWGSGMCDKCYDDKRRQEQGQRSTQLKLGVQATILAQAIFYMAPGTIQPSLFIQIKEAGYFPGPSGVYAAVLTLASVAAMIAPVPLGMWAERRGEREVYVGITLAAAVAAFALVLAPNSAVFAVAWAVMNVPPSIRGVRAVYYAKNVDPEDLSRAGQLASSGGLVGGFVGPLASTAFQQFHSQPAVQFVFPAWLGTFNLEALFACGSCLICAIALACSMPAFTTKRRGGGSKYDDEPEECERCGQLLEDHERSHNLALCDTCYGEWHFGNFLGESINFYKYRRRVLVTFCIIASLLEVSMNAGVIATFQPLAVLQLGWGNDYIAAVNFSGSALSVVISLLMVKLRLDERLQMAIAAGLYTLGVLVFTFPPVSASRMVIGFLLGIKAQILFMAPFTSIFSRLIGNIRVTNQLTTVLCLAPAIGAALGTAFAPTCIHLAGSPWSMVVAMPAIAAAVIIAMHWRDLEPRMAHGGRRAGRAIQGG